MKGRTTRAPESALSPAERLRVKMWQARASNSKSTGIVLLIFSSAFLAASFLASSSSFEIVAIISFVFGVFLVSSGLEAHVKLIPSAEAVLGPLLALSDDLKQRGFNGRVDYVPRDEGEPQMQLGMGPPGGEHEMLVPIGRGLVSSYERELGPLKGADLEYVKTWVPRLMVKGLALAESVKIDIHDGSVLMNMRRSVMRPLCVREDVNEKVCSKIGCPLVSSVGEALASCTGKAVRFEGCTYDPISETSTAKFKLQAE